MTLRRLSLPIWSVLLLSCAGTGGLPSAMARPWVRVTTTNFDIVSSLDLDTSRGAAIALERFRALVFLLLGAPNLESPVPTKIYLFRREFEYDDFRPHRDVAGFFLPGMRTNVATAVETRGMDLSQIVNHEYVHFVLRNASAAMYPMWYDEGFAEFLGASFVRDGRIWVGAIPEERIPSFQHHPWIGLDRIVSAGGYGDFSKHDLHMVYAESWALVHYLVLQREGEHRMRDELSSFLTLVNGGTDASAAFETAFGAHPDEVGRALQKELSRGRLRQLGFPLDALDVPDADPRVRTLSKLEIAIELGQLGLSVGNGDSAQQYFAAALAIDPDHARVQAGLGDAHKFQDRYDAALPYFDRSIELAPDDALNQLDYAEFLHDMALRDEFSEQRDELLDRARSHYVKAWKLDPKLPETYAMYGRSFLPKGQNAAKCTEMLAHAHGLLPSNTDILELRAACFVANGDHDSARNLIDRVVAWSTHSGDREGEVDRRMEVLVEHYARTEADEESGG